LTLSRSRHRSTQRPERHGVWGDVAYVRIVNTDCPFARPASPAVVTALVAALAAVTVTATPVRRIALGAGSARSALDKTATLTYSREQ
jgi:hypothetical protein